ncbi:hypothetical protein RO3G_09344 [Rhizopus delemar RA 99-880]|uniref:Uncharacterized protein n=1 Tax=Rhizopus delemar (strain RA 99-880 / ATCC MYA-4621 / FGSC 9543 / NRRL 43880) TaxID=246409 RepID=I1C854_RHIO9|nr:hypothetical protein RO3G_09344 [Rhizopus delemar RA 99-880]|eukprot:EIE84634.1 hypothetical protein RO3G_09344 [Rhizopus delemar RA 99-880]
MSSMTFTAKKKDLETDHAEFIKKGCWKDGLVVSMQWSDTEIRLARKTCIGDRLDCFVKRPQKECEERNFLKNRCLHADNNEIYA